MSTTAGVSYGEAETRAEFDRAFGQSTADDPFDPIVTLMPLCDFD